MSVSPRSAINPLFFTALIGIFVIILVVMAVPSVSNKSKKAALAIWPILFVLFVLFSENFLYIGTTFSLMGYVWLFALPVMAYIAVNQNSMEKLLLVVWTIVLLWALVQQNRFSYYFIVPLVILTSWAFMKLFYAIEADKAWETLKKNYSSKKRQNKRKTNRSRSSAGKSAVQARLFKISKESPDNGNEIIFRRCLLSRSPFFLCSTVY